MPPWSLQNSQNWLIFSHVKKKCQNKIFFYAGPPPPPELHIRIVKKSIFHVPGYMDLKKNQNSMYPGTWIWRKNKIPCTGVHKSERKIFLCIPQGGVVDFFVLDKFFQHVKKILNFWNFVSIKVAPFMLNHLGFYCIYSLFWQGNQKNQKLKSKLRTNRWDILYNGFPRNWQMKICSRLIYSFWTLVKIFSLLPT